MAEREVDPNITEVPELDETLVKVLQYVVQEGRERYDKDGDFAPFTAVAVKDTLIIETMEGEEPDELYKMARHTVQNISGADAYAFCYDGYLNTDAGEKDAIIAEGGVPGEHEGAAVGLVYEEKEEGGREYFTPIAYIGVAPNFMEFTAEVKPLDEDEDEDDTDERGQDEEAPED